MYLNQLQEGETAKVTDIHLNGDIRRRLLDLGLIIGTDIKCVLKSCHGDPIAYRVRGALIALRICDAEKIQINKG